MTIASVVAAVMLTAPMSAIADVPTRPVAAPADCPATGPGTPGASGSGEPATGGDEKPAGEEPAGDEKPSGDEPAGDDASGGEKPDDSTSADQKSGDDTGGEKPEDQKQGDEPADDASGGDEPADEKPADGDTGEQKSDEQKPGDDGGDSGGDSSDSGDGSGDSGSGGSSSEGTAAVAPKPADEKPADEKPADEKKSGDTGAAGKPAPADPADCAAPAAATPAPGAAEPAPGAPGAGAATSAAMINKWGEPNRVDEFDKDLSGWSAYDGPGHAGNGRRSPDAASVKDGLLTINGDAEGTTAGLAWNPGQKYGRWEGRVKAPASDPSYNALLLLWPDAENFPVGGEVDFMEMSDSTRQKTEMFLHYGEDNSQVQGEVKVDATQWQNWAVEWTPDHITAFLNGKEWWTTKDTSILPPGPMHLCIQLDWFPKGEGDVKPSEMQVDWVKQYSIPESEQGDDKSGSDDKGSDDQGSDDKSEGRPDQPRRTEGAPDPALTGAGQRGPSGV
ncbi:family 16 glycosylhydrolase [Pseudonocardia sediminis]|uniref:family 16 glycosylhydrolase n=1 Tax=Pseudonocardia sediminis TaxID=1397368 RepID=UPI001029C83F|nr:family 16 glycosylhydrolase [Pseudonocardia sediminis]